MMQAPFVETIAPTIMQAPIMQAPTSFVGTTTIPAVQAFGGYGGVYGAPVAQTFGAPVMETFAAPTTFGTNFAEVVPATVP